MAAFEQSRIFNPEFNIKWSFVRNNGGLNVLGGKRLTREKFWGVALGLILDRLVDQLEGKDSRLVKAVSYGFCLLSLVYFAGHLVRAAFN